MWWNWKSYENKCSIADIQRFIDCNKKEPRNPGCMSDLQIHCMISCNEFGLKYLEFEPEFFGLSKCWCLNDNLPVVVPMRG